MWELILVGVAGTAVGGLVASLVVLFVQERREDRKRPAREVAVARAVAQEAAAREMHYLMAEINHCIGHLRDGNSAYEANLRERVATMRRQSRMHEPLLGAATREGVTRYTDTLLDNMERLASPPEDVKDLLTRQSSFLAGAIEGSSGRTE